MPTIVRRPWLHLAVLVVLTAGCSGGGEPPETAESRLALEVLASLAPFQGTAADYRVALDACEKALRALDPLREAVQQGKTGLATLNPLLSDLEAAVPNRIFELQAINQPYYDLFASLGPVGRDLRLFGTAKPEVLETTLRRGTRLDETCADIEGVDALRN